MNKCEICGSEPMTVNCNNANCDTKKVTRKTIIITDDRIDILKDGYNITEKSIHGDNVPEILKQTLDYAIENLDMDNMDAISVLSELKDAL